MTTTPQRQPITDRGPRSRADIAGLIGGTLVAGGAGIYLLCDRDLMSAHHIGLSIALLLVLSGIIGLAGSAKN